MLQTLDTHRLRSAMASTGVSQSALVERSGVSRAQLSRLLAGTESRIRQSTLERLASTLGVSPDTLLVGGVIPRYRRWLAEEVGYIDFRGFGMPAVQRQPIQDVFVDLVVEEVTGECQDECAPPQSQRRNLKQRVESGMAATRGVLNHDRVIVLGSPGGGKTTLLRYLAYSSAVSTEKDAETPIYVRLPEFCRAQELDEHVDLVKFLAARAAERGCPPVEEPLKGELAADKRRCLVLLDGLDEVGNPEQRQKLVESVQALVERYPRNRYAVTSRTVGFDAGPWRRRGFSVFRMLEYDQTRLEQFAEKWAKVLSRTENKPYKEVRERLGQAVFANPRVKALASNPLIVTILALLNEARGGMLPRRRVDLYEKVVDVFLDTWETSKRSAETFEDTRGIDLDAREFRWLLSDLALAMQKVERTLAPRWWIAEKIEDYLQHKLGFSLEEAKDVCDRIIRYLAERTGLIEERGLGLFAFSHRTLQEYFASLGVIDEAEAAPERSVAGYLRGHYYHPHWPEVVRLVAAQLTPPLAEPLLSSILDDPDPVGRFLRRGHLLVLRCLSDGTSIANRRFIGGILDSLAELGRSRWLGITLEAIEALQGFQGTRFEESAECTVTAILGTARQELDEEEYECLYSWANGEEVSKRTLEMLPASFRTEEAAREIAVPIDDATCQVVYVNAELLTQNPDQWHASARVLLADPKQTPRLKQAIVQAMGRRVATDRRCRVHLREILGSSQISPLRVACVWALARLTTSRPNISSLLVRLLNRENEDDQVRRACAVALKDAAERDSAIADQLAGILAREMSTVVRAGAARGLAKVAASQPVIRESLESRLTCDREPEEVRIACAWALKPHMAENPVLLTTLKRWLDSPSVPLFQRVAAELLAAAMADETLEWDSEVMRKAEDVLMGLEDPCPCALDSLQAVATAREVRQGLRLESILRDSLQPVSESIELAFVFGSTARNRQMEDSDIDLLIIGDATLRSLSGPLRQAEKVLGRRINPAIYRPDSFRERYHQGDPFLLDICRREKIPVMDKGQANSKKEFEDELRAMVAERMDSTA